MKHIKRISAFLLTAILALGLFAPLAHAAPDGNTAIVDAGGANGIFEVLLGGAWTPLSVPFWIEENGGNVSFCLESNKSAPEGDGYSMSEALYSEYVQTGVRAILLHGFPNDSGGLSETEARYATQAAIWTWSAILITV